MAAQAREAGCPEGAMRFSDSAGSAAARQAPATLLEPCIGASGSVTCLQIDEVTRSIAALDAPDVVGDEIGLSLPVSWRGP